MRSANPKRFRVIVGVDFSEQAANAIYESVQLARVMPRINMHYVHVVETPSDLDDANVIEALNERLSRTLIRLERYVRDALFAFGGNEAWGCDVAFHVRLGAPAPALRQAAADADADLIIVGADQVSGLRKLFHRSTAEQLVRMAHMPVVVAHQKNFRTPARAPSEPVGTPHGGLTTHSYVDFGEPRRDSHLNGSF
ncbi:MAG: universal stress protein [Myxococcales bacterium]